jgi:hypothetical protein
MISKSGSWFSEKIMFKQKAARERNSSRRQPA